MQTGVDIVNIVQIHELAAASGVDLSWLFAVGHPSLDGTKKYSFEEVATIISEQIGSVTVPDPLYYTPAGGSVEIPDSALDGKDYYLFKWGVGPLKKGDDWQNDVVGGGWRLIDQTTTQGEVYAAVFKPQISNILASPDAIARFSSGILELTASTTISAGNFRKIFILKGAEITTLPLAADYPPNVALFIASDDGPRKQSTIQTQGADVISANSGTLTKLYLGQREFVTLITDGTKWYLQSNSPAIFSFPTKQAGWFFDATVLNTLPLTGGLYIRADYPRLWANIAKLAAAIPTAVVNEASWALNKTLWGSGNGTTTFRVPDHRGYFDRNMDLGADIDSDRNDSGIGSRPGTAQATSNLAHTHILTMQDSTDNLSGTGYIATTGSAAGPGYSLNHTINSIEGGVESRPINVALYPLINI
jgi:hypothetical protein